MSAVTLKAEENVYGYEVIKKLVIEKGSLSHKSSVLLSKTLPKKNH